jgi:hypothetical protein
LGPEKKEASLNDVAPPETTFGTLIKKYDRTDKDPFNYRKTKQIVL